MTHDFISFALIAEYFLLGLALAADASSVSLVYGAKQQPFSWRKSFLPAFSFGLAQFVMPVAGWFGGALLSSFIEAVDHWIAFGILLIVGAKFIWDSRRPQDETQPSGVSGAALFFAAFATSIDACAVGFGLRCADQPIWLPSAVIGVTTFGCSMIAHWLGSRLGAKFGPKLLIVGGFILIAIGTKILLEHLGLLTFSG